VTSARTQTLATIGEARVGAIIRTRDQQLASDAMSAAVDGGFRVIEFTLNTPGAFELITKFAHHAELIVGAGTVMSVEHVRRAVDAGARFIVSPICDVEVIAAAGELGVVSIPGTFTPTEMIAADRAGADVVKLFPAPADIPRYIRQVVGPLPHLRVFPTAGVTPENYIACLDAGAFGVGFVSSLFAPQDMELKDFSAIRRRAAEIVNGLAGSRK
jgi:2-dehydro-3-deoxyphosphogluconate aldolase/(4S)-4-hydroxy-2-oxoglutarate aldolase